MVVSRTDQDFSIPRCCCVFLRPNLYWAPLISQLSLYAGGKETVVHHEVAMTSFWSFNERLIVMVADRRSLSVFSSC